MLLVRSEDNCRIITNLIRQSYTAERGNNYLTKGKQQVRNGDMEEEIKERTEVIRKYVTFIFSVIFSAGGICLSTRSMKQGGKVKCFS